MDISKGPPETAPERVGIKKKELLAKLEKFNDDALIVISFNATEVIPQIEDCDGVAFNVASVDDGWEPSNVATLVMGGFEMG